MLTNASIGVGTRGSIGKFIAVNPKGNNCKLANIDLQVPLNLSVADFLNTEYRLSIQILVTAEEPYAQEVYDMLEARFKNSFIPLDFCWRKQRIIALTRQNNKVEEIAEILGVSVSAVTQHRAVIYDLLESEYGKPRITHSICWYADMAGLG
ncbi:MAG: hypothetical protein POELPBGB_00373 [Bacteroidia bacterium]|nr:hypothetical protein [Bacteroidia bacterium]